MYIIIFSAICCNSLPNCFSCWQDWWRDLLQENNYREVDYSGKMVLVLDILKMCSDVGDKALVFSQSLLTLDLIEFYLSKLPRPSKSGKYWKKGKDWYRYKCRTLTFVSNRNCISIEITVCYLSSYSLRFYLHV